MVGWSGITHIHKHQSKSLTNQNQRHKLTNQNGKKKKNFQIFNKSKNQRHKLISKSDLYQIKKTKPKISKTSLWRLLPLMKPSQNRDAPNQWLTVSHLKPSSPINDSKCRSESLTWWERDRRFGALVVWDPRSERLRVRSENREDVSREERRWELRAWGRESWGVPLRWEREREVRFWWAVSNSERVRRERETRFGIFD